MDRWKQAERRALLTEVTLALGFLAVLVLILVVMLRLLAAS